MTSKPHSMTGFGRASSEGTFGSLTVEIRSYNHRFQEISMKLPRAFLPLEGNIKTLFSERIHRGRIDVTVTRVSNKLDRGAASVNEPLFKAYLSAYESAFDLANVGTMNRRALKRGAILSILNRPDVLSSGESDLVSEQEKEVLFQVINSACSELLKMREEEGARLLTDFETRLSSVGGILKKIQAEAEASPSAIKERIATRIKKFSPEVTLDESRLAQEIAILADKSDITEETVRLSSHLSGFNEALRMRPAGRRLDFLLQEMGRECTTIAAKAQSSTVQHLVVDVKVEIERMREQIQNIE